MKRLMKHDLLPKPVKEEWIGEKKIDSIRVPLIKRTLKKIINRNREVERTHMYFVGKVAVARVYENMYGFFLFRRGVLTEQPGGVKCSSIERAEERIKNALIADHGDEKHLWG